MKKVIALLMAIFFLTGCSSADTAQDGLLQMRKDLESKACQFQADVRADFGEYIYDFSLNCQFDTAGTMTFSVIAPESISGISGTVSSAGGKLTFDGTALGFPLLADGELSPVTGPWLFMKGLRNGYLASWAQQGEGIRLTIDDSFENAPMQMRVNLNHQMAPVSAEILWDGRSILSVQVGNFRYL